MELRLLVAFILMGAVLFLTPYFYKNVAPPVKKNAPVAVTSAPAASGANAVAPPVAPAETTVAAAAENGAAPRVAAKDEQMYAIDTDFFRISLSNRGGVVKSWLLKKYRAHGGNPLELINTAAKVEPPFSLYFPGPKPSPDVNQALYEAKPDADGLGISFDFSDGNTTAHKTFRFSKSSYLSTVSTEVTAAGKPVPHLVEWRGGFGDVAVANPSGAGQTLRFLLEERPLAIQRVVISESVRFPELGRAFHENGPGVFRRVFGEWLTAETMAGRLAVPDPAIAADQFIGLLRSGLYLRATLGLTPPPTEAEIDATVAATVDIFLKAYGPSGSHATA